MDSMEKAAKIRECKKRSRHKANESLIKYKTSLRYINVLNGKATTINRVVEFSAWQIDSYTVDHYIRNIFWKNNIIDNIFYINDLVFGEAVACEIIKEIYASKGADINIRLHLADRVLSKCEIDYFQSNGLRKSGGFEGFVKNTTSLAL